MRKAVELADGKNGRENLSVPQGALNGMDNEVRQAEKPCRRSAKHRSAAQAS